MEKMTPAEYRAFLLDTARTGKLATVCHDGRPPVAPIWIDIDGDTIIFTTGENSVKGKNMRRDPRVNLCLDDEKPPFAYVLIEGIVSLEDQAHDRVLYWATRIAGRYMGAALAEAYGERYSAPGEMLVRLTPTKILAFKSISD
jgi:PPOX class probable F420-dependent enzyme